MRRCGKSTVLRLFGEQLLAEGIDRSTIISINFESMGEDYPPRCQAALRLCRLKAIRRRQLRLSRRGTERDELRARRRRAVCTPRRGPLYHRLKRLLSIRGACHTAHRPLCRDTGHASLFCRVSLRRYSAKRRRGLQPLPHIRRTSLLPANRASPRHRRLSWWGLQHRHRQGHSSEKPPPRMDMRAFSKTTAFLADNIGNTTSQKKISEELTASGHKIFPTTVAVYIN